MLVMANKKLTLIKPKRLIPGDVIGIAAPAGPFDRDEFDRGIEAIKSLGFDVCLPQRLQQAQGFLAASDNHRVGILMDLFGNPEVDAIICARGGYGSIRILERLDYEVLRAYPKVFIGFSDISALHTAIFKLTGLVVFHGPMVTSLGKSGPRTLDSLMAAVTSDAPLEVRPSNTNKIYPGKASGEVVGGNLATLCHLLGTPYAPVYKDCILLLEDTTEAPYKIDRMLFQMKMAGCFEGMAGLVLGSFQDCGNYQEICDIVGEIFEEMQVPVLAGFEIGHGSENVTIPLGISATLDTERGSLNYREVATSP